MILSGGDYMLVIDELIAIIKNLILYRGRVDFTHPEYRKFHDGITEFVYKNNFDETIEWKNIDKYLLIKSNQFMTIDEANIILQNLEKLKRLFIKKYSKQESENVVCYCNKCKINSKHIVLSYISDKGSDEVSGVSWADKYQIIRCDTCNTISFRKDGWFSEYQYLPDDDGSYEMLYPESTENRIEQKEYDNLPYRLDEIYDEVIKSFNTDNCILCAVGIRAILEGICSDKNIKEGRVPVENNQLKKKNNLEGRIYGLEENGIISKNQQEALHQLRFLGNDAVHELSKPSKSDLKTALEIIEHMRNDIYELPNKAEKLKNHRRTR